MFGFDAMRSTVILGVLASSMLLTACNGDNASAAAAVAQTPASSGSTSGTTPTTPATGATTPGTSSSTSGSTSTAQTMSLSGSAPASINVGSALSFTPTLAGAGSAVGYSIQNKPTWATFNVATGALTGTPTSANVGTYANIVISAADAAGSKASLAAFSLTVAQAGTPSGSATLSWTPPTQNTDGSAVSALAGYRIYYGASADAMTKSVTVTNPSLTAYTVANLAAGKHYFGITAYTTGGLESGMSNIGSKTIM